jgi:hypothetical protein
MVMVSAGIQVNELDFSDYAPRLGITRPVFVGGASKGAPNTVIEVNDEAALVRAFGPPLLTDYGLQAAVQYLRRGDQLKYLRVGDSSMDTADLPIPGTSGGTPAVAATGAINFTGSANPTDGETVTLNDGVTAIAATGDIEFTGGTQPTDGDTVLIDDGTGVAAAANVTFTSTPTTGDTVTIDDAEGNSETFEFTDGGGASPGNIEVNKSATVDAGASEFRTALNGSSLNITCGAITGAGPWVAPLTHDVVGTTGNFATIASAGTTPPAHPSGLSGGAGAVKFEFDDDATTESGHVAVTIGATTPDTLDDMVDKINLATAIDVSAADTTGVGDPTITCTHGTPGAAGNSATMAAAGATPPTVAANFTGGADGTDYTFEFDDDSSVTPGNIAVLIGATAAATMANLIIAINASAVQIVAVDATVTVPNCALTNAVPGDAGNKTITETGANIGVSGMSGGTDAIPGSLVNVMTIYAASPGTWGNEIQVLFRASTVFDAPAGNFDMLVYAPDSPGGSVVLQETFLNLSLTSSDARFVETVVEQGIPGEVNPSEYVTVDVLSDGTVTAATYTLGTGAGTVGNDGVANILSTDYIGTVTGTVATGLQALRNPETIEFNLIAVPGVTHKDVIAAIEALINFRADCLALQDPPFGLDRDGVVDWHNGLNIAVPNAPTSPLTSNRMTMTGHAWVKRYDPYSETSIWMPPSGQVAAQAAYTDSVSFPWFPIAGHNRGVLDADEVEWSPDRDDRAILAAGQNRVNPIVDFVGQGPTLFDNWTLQRTPTALDQVHVRRLLLHAEKLCATAVKYLVFEPHDPVTWKRFTQLCNTELSAIAASRGLETFKVICDESTNPASQRANKVMKGKLLMVPINAVRELVMDFAVYASGTEFEEEL